MKITDKLFAYQCIKSEPSKAWFGLSSKRYKKGDFVSYNGDPVKSIRLAAINTLDDYDPLETEELAEYFQRIEFKIVPV